MLAEIRKTLERIYAGEDKDKDVSKLTDEEVIQLATNLKEGVPFATPVFDGAAESEINGMLEMAASMQAILLCGREHKEAVGRFLEQQAAKKRTHM